MSEVLNKRNLPYGSAPNAVYVGRPTRWGNPFRIGPYGTREEVIDKYLDWVTDQADLMASLGDLRDRDLICWCAPLPCHADVLLELASEAAT